MTVEPRISLIIPIYNESRTIKDLLDTIKNQVLLPDEVILVDGGSTDNTAALIRNLTASDERYRVIEVDRAYPGKGRNIGAQAARNEWLAFTDAGIKLAPTWLKELAEAQKSNPNSSVIYGNFDPQQIGLYQKCATIAYVSPAKRGLIRGRSVVSCLIKKEVWIKVGGFPDWRAAEDLEFMDRINSAGYNPVFAPAAKAYWQLQPTLFTTYRKFRLYSEHNVWAGRQRDWHYGVLRHYLLMIIFLSASFLVDPLVALLIPGWMIVRALKRGYDHKYEFGIRAFLDPRNILLVALITFFIDLATIIGWISAATKPNPLVVGHVNTIS